MLLLRATVAVTAIAQGGFCLSDPESQLIWTQALALAEIGGGVGLLVGFLTPVSAFLVFLGSAVSVFSSYQSASPNLTAVRFLIFSVVIILLGPGAFSLDARLFGQREIIIPERLPKS